MKQFVLPPEDEHAETVRITGREYHYLKVVRRYRPGDTLPALTSAGVPKSLTITEIGADYLLGRLQPREPARSGAGGRELSNTRSAGASRTAGDRRSSSPTGAGGPRLVLCPATLKGRKLDQVIRQVTEAGVSAVRPVVTLRSVSDPLSSGRAEKKAQRWRTIAREAVQQSGRREIPEIDEPVTLDELLDAPRPESLLIFFHEADPEAPALSETLRRCARAEEIRLLLGPEGGLAPEEVAKLRRVGGVSSYLGHRVLRSETAALYAVAAVQTLLEEVREWE